MNGTALEASELGIKSGYQLVADVWRDKRVHGSRSPDYGSLQDCEVYSVPVDPCSSDSYTSVVSNPFP